MSISLNQMWMKAQSMRQVVYHRLRHLTEGLIPLRNPDIITLHKERLQQLQEDHQKADLGHRIMAHRMTTRLDLHQAAQIHRAQIHQVQMRRDRIQEVQAHRVQMHREAAVQQRRLRQEMFRSVMNLCSDERLPV